MMKEQMRLVQGIPVSFGIIEGVIYGGPFRMYQPKTRRLVGVKMAQEIQHPHDFKVDTEDFSTPTQADMQKGIMFGLHALAKGSDVYAGCMGGIGRTGLYMACMTKVMIDYSKEANVPPPIPNRPVAYVRAHYKEHAVETAGQNQFVIDFDTTQAVQWLIAYNSPREITVEKIVYLSPLQWVKNAVTAVFSKS